MYIDILKLLLSLFLILISIIATFTELLRIHSNQNREYNKAKSIIWYQRIAPIRIALPLSRLAKTDYTGSTRSLCQRMQCASAVERRKQCSWCGNDHTKVWTCLLNTLGPEQSSWIRRYTVTKVYPSMRGSDWRWFCRRRYCSSYRSALSKNWQFVGG